MTDNDFPPVEGFKGGVKIASYAGRITLYDPDPDDVSRANRPLVPDAPTVKAIERQIIDFLAGLGFAGTVELTRTDNDQ